MEARWELILEPANVAPTTANCMQGQDEKTTSLGWHSWPIPLVLNTALHRPSSSDSDLVDEVEVTVVDVDELVAPRLLTFERLRCSRASGS